MCGSFPIDGIAYDFDEGRHARILYDELEIPMFGFGPISIDSSWFFQ